MRFVFSIWIFLTRKIAKTNIILTRNFGGNNTNIKTYIILAQNFREINADFKYIQYVFQILIFIYLNAK
jgi:hypothetical protein